MARSPSVLRFKSSRFYCSVIHLFSHYKLRRANLKDHKDTTKMRLDPKIQKICGFVWCTSVHLLPILPINWRDLVISYSSEAVSPFIYQMLPTCWLSPFLARVRVIPVMINNLSHGDSPKAPATTGCLIHISTGPTLISTPYYKAHGCDVTLRLRVFYDSLLFCVFWMFAKPPKGSCSFC